MGEAETDSEEEDSLGETDSDRSEPTDSEAISEDGDGDSLVGNEGNENSRDCDSEGETEEDGD